MAHYTARRRHLVRVFYESTGSVEKAAYWADVSVRWASEVLEKEGLLPLRLRPKRQRLTIRTPAGTAEVWTREDPSKLELLAAAFCECGCASEAARRAGLKRRAAHDFLARMGLHVDGHARRSRTKVAYTHAVTGKTILVLYAWGTVHRSVQLYERGERTIREISSETGVPRDTLHGWFESLGMELRPRLYESRATRARRHGFADQFAMESEILRLRTEHDCSVDEITKQTGIPRSTVTRILARRTGKRRDPAITRRKRIERRIRSGRPPYSYKTGGGDSSAREARRRQVLEKKQRGVPVHLIANELDVSIATVYNDLKAAPPPARGVD